LLYGSPRIYGAALLIYAHALLVLCICLCDLSYTNKYALLLYSIRCAVPVRDAFVGVRSPHVLSEFPSIYHQCVRCKIKYYEYLCLKRVYACITPRARSYIHHAVYLYPSPPPLRGRALAQVTAADPHPDVLWKPRRIGQVHVLRDIRYRRHA